VVLGVALALVTGVPGSVLIPWEPGKNPVPYTILSQAERDAATGRYANALTKHVWLFDNTLKYAPAMAGVRLSFALGDWAELGKTYPPALDKLRAVRDSAAEKVKNGPDAPAGPSGRPPGFRDFNDFQAINRTLGEYAKTSDLFSWLDANKPRLAAAVFRVAEPALVRAKMYPLCGRYLDADKELKRMVFLHDETQNAMGIMDSKEAAMLRDYEERSFANQLATLVALLALNGCTTDALRVAGKGEMVRSDEKLRGLVNGALKGQVPEPWPWQSFLCSCRQVENTG
jgi:hypothetical protein